MELFKWKLDLGVLALAVNIKFILSICSIDDEYDYNVVWGELIVRNTYLSSVLSTSTG